MKNRLSISLILMACAGLLACGTGHGNATSHVEEVYAYLNDPDHHLVKRKTVDELDLEVRWLPPALKAQDLLATLPHGVDKDSLLHACERQVHLVLTLRPSEQAGGQDVMKMGVANQVDYTSRMANLNFHLEEHGSLEAQGQTFPPVLALLENTYGLTQDRDLHFVFAESTWESQGLPTEFTFEYDDTEYGTGHHVFRFRRSDMDKAPQLKL